MDNPILNAILHGLLGGALGHRLMQMVKPATTSEFDAMSKEELHRRNNWIYVTADVIFIAGLVLLFVIIAALGLEGRSPWRVVFWFFFPVTLMMAFIAAVTLPSGRKRFREFWRFQELKYRAHWKLTFSLCVAGALVGLIAAISLIFFATDSPPGECIGAAASNAFASLVPGSDQQPPVTRHEGGGYVESTRF